MDSAWNTTVREQPIAGPSLEQPWEKREKERKYYPLLDTLRLYAGWLAAWYFVIFAIGSYQSMRSLPFRIGFIDDLYHSSLIFPFALASFLFLLMTTLHRLWGRGMLKGIALWVVGIVVFVFFLQNT